VESRWESEQDKSTWIRICIRIRSRQEVAHAHRQPHSQKGENVARIREILRAFAFEGSRFRFRIEISKRSRSGVNSTQFDSLCAGDAASHAQDIFCTSVRFILVLFCLVLYFAPIKSIYFGRRRRGSGPSVLSAIKASDSEGVGLMPGACGLHYQEPVLHSTADIRTGCADIRFPGPGPAPALHTTHSSPHASALVITAKRSCTSLVTDKQKSIRIG